MREFQKDLEQLRKVISPLTEFNISELQKVKEEMEEVLFSSKYGVGLAAPQIGIELPCIIVCVDGKKNKSEFIINPEIISYSDSVLYDNESCLSFPGITTFNVKRSKTIEVRGKKLNNGKLFDYVARYTGMNARIFQHEVDHINGIEMFDRASTELPRIEPDDLSSDFNFIYRADGYIFIIDENKLIDLYTNEDISDRYLPIKVVIGVKVK